MALTIYGIIASRALRPLWAATELGLDFEHVQTDYKVGTTRTCRSTPTATFRSSSTTGPKAM